jgi:glutamyl-tRNA synthetase
MFEKVRTRFAPSPTGYLHVGGARTALFNWLLARHYNGSFVLRIEDTDQIRSTDQSTRAIIDAMSWLGLNWDEGPFFQAQRVDIHRQKVQQLLDEGKAYFCTCSPDELEERRKRALAEGRKPKYDGTCRDKQLSRMPNAAVRFRSPDVGTTVVNDMIKGTIVFNNEELDDLVIERSDGYPTYNFAVVVDDAEMDITHVIRGDDHVNNTPRQILLYQALGYEVPFFGHVPMILGSDKTRLSKRHGATSVMSYKEMGYLPEALVNYLVRLGWSHGDQEIFSMEELVRLFFLDAVGKSAAVFNPDKLLWLNQHYIRESSIQRLINEMIPFWQKMQVDISDTEFVSRIIGDIKTRVKSLLELAEASEFYFAQKVIYAPEAAEKYLTRDVAGHLESIKAHLSSFEEFTKEGIEKLLREIADERNTKLKIIAPPLRVALTGKTVSPGLDEVMITLGKDRIMQRLEKAILYIQGR